EKLSAIGKHDEAEKVFRKIIEADPNNSIAYNDLAYILWQKSRLHEAKNVILEAVKLSPDNRNIIWNLGVILSVSGFYDKAKQILQSYLKQYPNDKDMINFISTPPDKIERLKKIIQ
ncbi:MAG: hypothetical protein OMM_14655, partial [Candidatus Magnetoglobus multicellularis str. Araruama]